LDTLRQMGLSIIEAVYPNKEIDSVFLILRP